MEALGDLAVACAHRLVDLGVRPGDRVLLAYPPDTHAFLAGFWACVLTGAVAVPVQTPAPTRLHAELPQLAHIVEDCGAKVALTTRRYWAFVQTSGVHKLYLRARGRPLPCPWPTLEWVVTDDLRPRRGRSPGAGTELPQLSVGSDDLAYLQYTSGSTSAPRGVMVSHRNALHNTAVIASETEVDERSVLVGWVPLFHDMGLVGGILNTMYSRAHLVFFSPLSFVRRPLLWAEAIARYGGTHTAAPDFGYQLLVAKSPADAWSKLDLRSWRFALQGGEVARPQTLDRLERTLGPAGFERTAFNNIYGLAESALYVCGRTRGAPTTLTVAAIPLETERRVQLDPGPDAPVKTTVSSGPPPSGVRVRIVSEDSRPLPENMVGEVWVASPSISRGYWGQSDEDNAARFRARVDDPTCADVGFLRTGDLGFMHEGELHICGRRKELVILGGRNLYPQDLELAAFSSHAALRKGCAAAFSVDDDQRESLVIVLEVKDPETTAERCRVELRRRSGGRSPSITS